jgi:hypothetical protein
LGQIDIVTDVYPFRYKEAHLLNKEKKKSDLEALHKSVRDTYENLILNPEQYFNEPINLQYSELHLRIKTQMASTTNPILLQIRSTRAVDQLADEPVILPRVYSKFPHVKRG